MEAYELVHPEPARRADAFRDVASEAGTTFGPLASSGEIKYPKWGARPDGSWRYEIVRLEAAEKAPESISFSAP